jgi:hypothetical protein
MKPEPPIAVATTTRSVPPAARSSLVYEPIKLKGATYVPVAVPPKTG